jgi:hypothetical protein
MLGVARAGIVWFVCEGSLCVAIAWDLRGYVGEFYVK